jgi:putative ABC transport system permease protein
MIRFSLRSLAGRKFRTSLTMIAIVLGVAMISGTYVLTDTIDKAFSTIFDESYAGTDVIVSGQGADISFQGTASQDPPVPEGLLAEIRRLDSVEAAMGGVYDELNAKILEKDGDKAIKTQGAPSFGFGIDTSPQYSRFNPLNLLEGRWPTDSREVVIDAGTADREGFALGDEVRISTLKPKQAFELVGIARYGDVDSLGTATFSVFDIRTAQELFDREGQFDAISVAGRQGTTPEQLIREIKPILPAGTKVRSAAMEAQEQKDEISEFTAFFRYFLLAFAGIALFVGAFVIFNTLSITVAQRTREFATVRTLGASRRQILGSVILEALVIGAIASLIGLFLGLLLAEGLQALFRALNVELPEAGTVFAARTVVVSLLVGIVITLAAGLFPAIRATRVPPIAAVREGAVLPRGRLAPFAPYVAVATTVLALALLGYAMFADDLPTGRRLLSIAAGVLALFLGVALLSSRVVRPLAIALSPVSRAALLVLLVVVWPFWTVPFWLLRHGAWGPGPVGARLAAFVGGALLNPLLLLIVVFMWIRAGVTSWRPEWPLEFPGVLPDRPATRIGGENVRRNPGRTAATAAALMIGVALVAFVATLTDGMRESNRGAIEDQIAADFIVTSQDGYTPFVAAAGDAVATAPTPEVVTHVRAEIAQFNGKTGYLTGIDPAKITTGYNFDWVEGSDATLAELGSNGVVVDEDFADEKGLAVGQTVEIRTGTNRTADVVVKGLYRPPPFYPLLGSVSIPIATFDTLVDRPRNQYTFVRVAGGPTETLRAELERAASGFPDSRVQTRQEWIDKEDAEFSQFLTLLYVLLALSVIVSLFGMVNTLVLSVFERTRELGMLRAIGMTRRQVRRMVRHESVITALIGAAIGVPLGIFLAVLVTRALAEFDVRFSVPWEQLVVLAVVAVVVGVIAAIMPARRAARLNPLEALHYE